MSIDAFSSQIFEEAKRFLEKYDDTGQCVGAYLHASLALAMFSLEAHVNAICEEFLLTSDLNPWERAILEEREVEFLDGEFGLGKRLKMLSCLYKALYKQEFPAARRGIQSNLNF